MASTNGDEEQIRLPELPVFKRYSLALRQEFASPEEILTMLERTSARIESIVRKAQKRKEPPSDPIEEAEPIEESDPAGSEETDFDATQLIHPDQLTTAEAPPGILEEDLDDRPFWDIDEPDAVITKARSPKPRPSKPKRKPPAPEIVRVGPRGQPIKKKTAGKTAGRPKARTTAKRKSGSAKRPK